MSYTVLARKFRSRTFDEVVGQSAITTTLKNAINQNRVHHGYLFCGTRGVGKTSVARILAKALNCLSSEGPTTTPCGTCDSCQMIARGEDMDVVEIDAASNTGVDHIRELRTNAVYRPTRSRFKIYIIDEVHMLSTGAFNALLKTLEEPPPHVKFIMATTESQKVPATILSRVQRFDFKSISPSEIAVQMTKICADEGIEVEPEALKRLARLANGSMRDGLSLLDQVISMGGKVSLQIVNEILPAAHDELFAALIDRLAEHDAAGALAVADQTLSQGHALDHWCNLLISQIRDLMLIRLCGEQTDLVDVPAGLRSQLAGQCKKFDGGAYVYFISVLEELRRSVKSSGSGRPLVEAALVRMAEAANFSSIESLLAQVQGGASTNRPAAPSASPPRVATSGPKTAPPPTTPPTGSSTSNRSAPSPAPPMKKRNPIASVAPPPVNPVTKRMTQADLKAAHAEPMVQAALEVFGGQIVHVQRDGAEAPGLAPEH